MTFFSTFGLQNEAQNHQNKHFLVFLELLFFEVHFGMTLERFGLDFGRPDPQSTRHGAVETHVGPFSIKNKNHKTSGKNMPEIAPKTLKLMNKWCLEILLFWWSFFSCFLVDLVSIWAPFWLHLGPFFSSKSSLFREGVQDGLQEAFGMAFGSIWVDLRRIFGGFGEIFGRLWGDYCKMWGRISERFKEFDKSCDRVSK